MNYIQKIYDDMSYNGIEFLGHILDVPSVWQRFSKPGKSSKSIYVFINPTRHYAIYGDFSLCDESFKVILNRSKYTEEDYREERKIALMHLDTELKISNECEIFWNECEDPDFDHPYLLKKHITPLHIRQYGKNYLICPLYTEFGKLVGLQSISPYGKKKFKQGSILKNSFMFIGDNKTKIIRLVEGYATGVSIHMATDDLVCVAYSATNLTNVAKILKRNFLKHEIIICSDPKPDEIAYAMRAAQTINCAIHCPVSHNSSLLDFNDIHVFYGIEALQGQLYSRSFRGY